MESRILILILCLLYVTRASETQSKEIEFKERFPRAGDVEDLSRPRASLQKTDGTDRQSAYKLRDKRALGLLLSGLAQIFGYTVTPIQVASLPNPMNVTTPAAMSNSSMMGNVMGQQTAPTQPMSMNVTVPKQQETIRFTGVVNFGNNSDVIGHLQRYEQLFHGRRNNATSTMMMTSQPVPMPMPPARISVDPTNLATRPPLLAPFFVKIPLPIAPDLPPATIPIENFRVSLPIPTISIVSESNETAETPIKKEQETIYRNNKNTERYTVEEKDIYDEKDVTKPMNHYTHQLHEPSIKQQHKQEEPVERLKEQKEPTNCDMNRYHKENELNERDRSREEEIANRNREHASKYKSTEEKKPAHDDEENAEIEESEENEENAETEENEENEENEETEESERNEEPTNRANKPSKQPPREDESEEVEDEDPDEQFRGMNKQPDNFDKYVQVGYNQQLPIGDYFHEGDPEVIRDSYGEILNNKRLEDDRIGYVNMFKHPRVYNSQSVPEDAPGEDEKEPPTADGYDEHLIRLQKLREEYALPKNKYEEYELNDESEAKRDDRHNERTRNRTSTRPKTERVRGKEANHRARIPNDVNKNILRDDIGNTRSREEVDFARHVPLIVPIRYIDTNDKVQQATTRQLSYKESDEVPSGRLSEGNIDPARGQPTPLIGLPERPRRLHEGEQKELQVWPPPFDYAFDNTAPTNTVISPNSQNYPLNYYQHVKNVAANDASGENSPEQPSGYLVVVGNSAHPYRYPYNFYYFPNENTNPQNQDPHPNTEGAYQRGQVYVPQNTNQQFIRTDSNLTEYRLNGTTTDHYRQPHEAPTNVLDRYRYIFDERTPEAKESVNIDLRHQIPNVENWSSRIYQSQPPSVLVQVQNVKPSSRNSQRRPSNSRYSRSAKKTKNPQPKDQRKNDGEVKSTPDLQPIPTSKKDRGKDDGKMKIPQPASGKPFDDPQSAHDFFGFNKDDYSFAGESTDASKVTEENGKIMKESDMPPLDPVVYHRDDESVVKHADEPENDTEKAKVTEYRNKVATLKEKREEVQRRNELENRMTEILENLKTRLLVE